MCGDLLRNFFPQWLDEVGMGSQIEQDLAEKLTRCE
jgi:hypothetical protein